MSKEKKASPKMDALASVLKENAGRANKFGELPPYTKTEGEFRKAAEPGTVMKIWVRSMINGRWGLKEKTVCIMKTYTNCFDASYENGDPCSHPYWAVHNFEVLSGDAL